MASCWQMDEARSQDQIPLLSLRMNLCKHLRLPHLDEDSDSLLDTLAVMTSQDAAYRCRDYLARRYGCKVSGNLSPCSVAIEQCDEIPDVLCREKMCEWSYRVCDHFRTNREIVAFAFSFLDRFVDRCNCDRTAFKLASMTSLYMATKVFNAKQISIVSLAELSRGEFEVSHIAEMEKIILETLDWRMNPPTVQSFVERLCMLIPLGDIAVLKSIYQRAIFFAELCIYDYEFVTEERYLIAVACILNAMEGMDDEYLYQTLPLEFIVKLRTSLCVDIECVALEHCQARLWFLYGCSAQLQHDDIMPSHIRKVCQGQHGGDTGSTFSNSPISVDGPY